jgi:hypothetical protein
LYRCRVMLSFIYIFSCGIHFCYSQCRVSFFLLIPR